MSLNALSEDDTTSDSEGRGSSVFSLPSSSSAYSTYIVDAKVKERAANNVIHYQLYYLLLLYICMYGLLYRTYTAYDVLVSVRPERSIYIKKTNKP